MLRDVASSVSGSVPAINAAHANRGRAGRRVAACSSAGDMASRNRRSRSSDSGSGGGGGGGGRRGRGSLLEAACPLPLSHHLNNGVCFGFQLANCSLNATGRAQTTGTCKYRADSTHNRY